MTFSRHNPVIGTCIHIDVRGSNSLPLDWNMANHFLIQGVNLTLEIILISVPKLHTYAQILSHWLVCDDDESVLILTGHVKLPHNVGQL